MAVAGNIIVDQWTVLAAADDLPLTGMTVPGDVTLTLLRQSGSTIVAAGESVTWTEIGATGRYYFSFTPENTGLYVLVLNEIAATSYQRKGVEFRYQVLSAGSAFSPSYANAFCAETDLERWLQQAISATTQPSDSEAAGFAESRAAVLMSLCAGLNYAVTPLTVTAGSRIEDLLREANAIGAALDCTVAQSFGKGPSKTERIAVLEGLWFQYAGDPSAFGAVGAARLKGFIEKEIRTNLVSLSTDHIISGDTTAAATESVTTERIQTRMSDVY